VTSATLDAALKDTPTGGVANKEYTQDEAVAAIAAK
jgi:hypothetical protein